MATHRDTSGGAGTARAARPKRRSERAAAARQALRLCEAELLSLGWDQADGPLPRGHGQSRIRVVTARAALRAAGVPPHTAATLRNRLRLAHDQEPWS